MGTTVLRTKSHIQPTRFVYPRLSCEVDGSAVLILDKAADPPIAFPACLSPLTTPTMYARAPDAGQWKEETDQEMEDLKSHDVYQLVPRTNGMRNLKLGGYLTGSSKMAFSRGRLLDRGNHQHPSID